MAAQPGRTDRAIDADLSFHPITWTLDPARVKQRDELERRSHIAFPDLLDDATGSLSETADPGLILRNLRREFARYGVTLNFAPHPSFGDVLARARFIGSGRSSDEVSGPIAIEFDEEAVAQIWADLAEYGVAPGPEYGDPIARAEQLEAHTET